MLFRCRFVRGQSQQPFSILVENHLAIRCKVWLSSQVLLHALEALGEHLRGDVGIVGTIEQMVGRGDGEQHADDLWRVGTGEVVVKGCEVGIPVDIAHEFISMHHGGERFHPWNHQRQIGSAMRHYHLDVGVASQHITTDHIRHGTGGL